MRGEFERIEALELLGMVVAHLNHAEASGDLSPRIPTLMGIRDKLAAGLREMASAASCSSPGPGAASAGEEQ